MIDDIFLTLEYSTLILFLTLIFVFVLGYVFGGEEVQEYAPNIKGRIANNGNAVSNTNVELVIRSSHYLFESRCLTNERGEFEFDSVSRTRRKILRCFDGIFQTMFSVEVVTSIDGRKVVLWKGVFRDFVIGENERANMSDLTCESTNLVKIYEFSSYGDSVISQCNLVNFLRVNR